MSKPSKHKEILEDLIHRILFFIKTNKEIMFSQPFVPSDKQSSPGSLLASLLSCPPPIGRSAQYRCNQKLVSPHLTSLYLHVSTSFTFLLRRTKQTDTDVTVVTVLQLGGCHSSYITGQIVNNECHASLLCSAPARGDSQLVWFRHVKARKA